MSTVRVLAPFVTLPVKDAAGATVVQGFYKDMLAHDVEQESLERHLRKGMVEVVDEPKAETATVEEPKAKTGPKPAAH